MKVELEIVKDTFTNDDGEVIEYFRCEAEILGQPIRFSPRKEDKKLLEYLIKQAGGEGGDLTIHNAPADA